jgi:hypothetical protein|tara:strand:+ start:2313 stop:2537 length:225 start_codon:yes stop_codon:yes gene_type:complete
MMTRLKFTDISPDGVRIVIDWEKFVPGASVFIPAINTIKAVHHLTEATNLTKKDIVYRVRIENGKYGVRVWRQK